MDNNENNRTSHSSNRPEHSGQDNQGEHHTGSKSQLSRIILIFVLALAVPAIPFALFGWWLEPQIETWIKSSWLADNTFALAGIIVSVLASDILLPIPSSAVCTFSGNTLGGIGGTIANWVGLNLSVVVGYWLGAKFGRPIAERFSSPSAIEQLDRLTEVYGIWSVLACRAVPIFAEATVLLVGVYRKATPMFWIASFAANLGIAVAYALLGKFAAENGWFSLAMALSVSIPIALLMIWLRKK